MLSQVEVQFCDGPYLNNYKVYKQSYVLTTFLFDLQPKRDSVKKKPASSLVSCGKAFTVFHHIYLKDG